MFCFAFWLWTSLQEEIVSGWQGSNKHVSTRTAVTPILRSVSQTSKTSKTGFVPPPRCKSSFLFGSVRDFPELGDVVFVLDFLLLLEHKLLFTSSSVFRTQAQLVSEQWSCDKHCALYVHFKDNLWQLSWGGAFGQAIGKHLCFRSSLFLFPCSLEGAALREGNISPQCPALHLSKALFVVGSHRAGDLGSPSRCPVVVTGFVRSTAQLCWSWCWGSACGAPWLDLCVPWGKGTLLVADQVQGLGCSGRDKVLLCSIFVVHQNEFEISFRVALGKHRSLPK